MLPYLDVWLLQQRLFLQNLCCMDINLTGSASVPVSFSSSSASCFIVLFQSVKIAVLLVCYNLFISLLGIGLQRPAICFFFSSSLNSQPNTFHFILIQLFAYPLGIIHVLPYFKCKLTVTVFIAICHLVLVQFYCLEFDLIQPFICILPEIYCMLCLLQVKSHRLLYKICCSIYTNSDMYDICRFRQEVNHMKFYPY